MLAALRVQDPEAVAAELHPEIEATGQKGTFKGIDAVVGWAKPSDDGHLRSRIEVDEVREVGDCHVVIGARKQWWWKDENQLADESPLATLFELRDGKVYRWTNFDSIVDAIDAVPAT